METSPEGVRGAESLRQYWTHGRGAAKVAWGTPGDFDRCVAEISKYMSPERAKGYCELRHQEATGMSTAEHAKLLKEHR